MTEENPGFELARADCSGRCWYRLRLLYPASVKALDRLIGAAVDIPVAWLAQKKARVDAQTEAYVIVEKAIAKAASTDVAADKATVQRAVDVLVRKEYRRQNNREAVSIAMLNDMRSANDHPQPTDDEPDASPAGEVDEDWLNVFERYAEDASTERMQNLWGRVLAGEIRKPGGVFLCAHCVFFQSFCAS